MGMFDNWMQTKSDTPAPAAVPPNGGNPPPTPANPNPNLQNNDGTNPDLIATIWDEEKKKPGEVDPTGSSDPAKPTTPAAKTTDEVRGEVAAHLNEVGLGDFTITPEVAAKIQEGDFTALTTDVNTRIQRAYASAVNTSQKLFNAQLEKTLPAMVEEAVAKSKAFIDGKELRSLLHRELPFTASPEVGPVAETIFRQFLTKGATREKGIQLTKQYFDRLRQSMDPEYIPSNNGTKTTFRGNPRQAGEMGWLDVLKGK